MASIDRLLTVTASTKRVGAVVDGLEPDPTTSIASLSCTPLDPLSLDVIQEYRNLGYKVTLYTVCSGDLDIEPNDLLVVSGTEYPIRAVQVWTWKDSQFQTLYVEELQ